MFSIICVYNNREKFESRLFESARQQHEAYELIGVDNRNSTFTSATQALNYGARQASGDWLIFAHQDVQLIGSDWLTRARASLAQVDERGWHGLVGRTSAGRWRGLIRDRAMVFGEPFDRAIEVQTLDELVLIHRRHDTAEDYFDERLSGWHAYGVDVCCTAIRQGARNTVLPLPVWHDSESTNQRGLREAHAYVWQKHRAAFHRVYTTCGVLPHRYGWSGSYRVSTLLRGLSERQYHPWLKLTRDEHPFGRTPWEVLEALTADEPVVDCLHPHHAIGQLTGTAFTDRTTRPRTIVHHFTGLQPAQHNAAPCTVIAPELAEELLAADVRPDFSTRLIVCFYLDKPTAQPAAWQKLLGADFTCSLAMEADETRWGILEVRRTSSREATSAA